MSVIDEKEREVHNALVASFQEKVEHARLLEKNMDKLIIDFEDIFNECEEHQTKHFALDLIQKVYYIIDRAKLLKTGQCLVPYQARTEREFISDKTCAFEEDVCKSGKFPDGLKLSSCSYEGIRYYASDRKSSQKLILDNARNDLDTMISSFLSALEQTLNVFHSRSFINKNELFISVKFREQIRIVAKPRTVLLDSEVMKTDYNINIFASTACLRDDIESLRITPLADCDHYAWLTTRAEREAEVQEFVEKRKLVFTEQKAQLAINKALNIGSRIPFNKKQKTNGGLLSTPLTALSGSQLTGGSFKTTCDTGGSSSASNVSSFLRNGDESGSFMDYGSTPIATGAGKKPLESQLDGLDLDEYNQEETAGERQARMRKKAKLEKLLIEKQQETKEFGDFFVEDGEREDVVDHFSPMALSNHSAKKSSVKFASRDDEEYSETDDYDLKQYLVVKKADKIAQDLRDSERSSVTKPTKASASKSSGVKGTPVLKNEAEMNPFGLDVVKFKPVSLRKKTKGEYTTDYVQEIEVFVQNKLYSKVVHTDVDGIERDVVVRTAEETVTANRELDVEFITFLVAHTVTIVGSEIALERCIIDYVLKKQKLNKLNQMEQQEISNWKDIFVNIENLLMSQVRDENITKKDLLDAALANTVNFNETKFRQARNAIINDSNLSGQDQADAISSVRKEADVQNAQAKSLAQEMKALLDATLKTTNQKINNAIHYIAMKVCVYWANINNCLDIIEPALVEKYNVRFLKHDTLKRQLACVEHTGRLLMSAPQCEDQPVAIEDIGNALMTEETQLRKIMQNDHAADLMNVIYSVKAKAADIVALVDIIWSKTPRTKLSTAVAVKKEVGEKKDTKASATPTPNDLTGSSISSGSTADNVVVGAAPLAAGSSTTGAGWTQTTLQTNMEGKLGLSLTSRREYEDNTQKSISSQSAIESTPSAPSAANQVMTQDQLPRARQAVMCYDNAIKALLIGLSVQNETLCLEIDFKDKRQFRHHRLALLQFLVTHHKSSDLDNVVKAFSEMDDIYDLLNCLFYVKVDGVDGSIIMGDGYCFYRAVYQLYLRHMGGYVRLAKDMKASDRKCNTKKDLNSADHAAFVVFVNQLKTLVKDNKQAIGANASELASFKFQRDCELLTVLLDKRPGVGVGTKQWGSQSAVSLLNFNVISLEVLGEKPTSVVEKQLAADVAGDKKSTRWTRFQASSVPDTRSEVSRSKSALSFQDLDMITSVQFNPLVYTPGHFTTGVTVHTIEVGSDRPLFDDFHDLKKRFLVEAFKRVRIVVEMQPDVLDKLQALNSFLHAKTGDFTVAAPLEEDDFNSNLFIERLHQAFPASVRVKGDLVDLSGEEESTDTVEIAELKEAVKVEHSKVELLIQHNNLLRNLLQADIGNINT